MANLQLAYAKAAAACPLTRARAAALVIQIRRAEPPRRYFVTG